MWYKVALSESLLIHAELDHCDWIGMSHREVSVLVILHKIGKHVEFIALGCPFISVHEFRHTFQRGLVVGFGTNILHIRHCYTSRTLMRSYSS